MKPLTLFEKIWNKHVVSHINDEYVVLYIDRHYIHEVTSPQAFNGLRNKGIGVHQKERTTATADHNVPTVNQQDPISDPLSRKQVDSLTKNCKEFGIDLFDLHHENQGIVHVIGPELGLTRPGMTIVCGDSHTSTHGAFGTIAFGIGTSEVQQVFASQCIVQKKPKLMKIHIDGVLGNGVTSKDLILYLISKLGVGGASGYFVEYSGKAISTLSQESRMTICNMSIEMGARGGLIAPDEKTFEYLRGTRFAPQGMQFEKSISEYKKLHSDSDAKFDIEYHFQAKDIGPMVTYGTNPGMGICIDQEIPPCENESDIKALNYMAFRSGTTLVDFPVDYVFIGSCTNARIEDLRQVANFVEGKHKAETVKAFIVPGSKMVANQAKKEGLDVILRNAGFELRGAGCSACLGMNDDKIPTGKYCISTSNRNFEGRQGPGARTILASPLMAAAAAIQGKIVDVRNLIAS